MSKHPFIYIKAIKTENTQTQYKIEQYIYIYIYIYIIKNARKDKCLLGS